MLLINFVLKNRVIKLTPAYGLAVFLICGCLDRKHKKKGKNCVELLVKNGVILIETVSFTVNICSIVF